MQIDAVVFIELNGQTLPAGRLSMIEDGRYSTARFAYGRRYLERPDAVAIDPVQLPLGSDLINAPDDFPLFNGIRDAAPDAWGRKLIERHVLRSLNRQAGEADFLLASQSGNRIGALRFGPTPSAPGQVLHYSLPYGFWDLGSLEAFQDMVDAFAKGDASAQSVSDFVAPGSDLGGARPKGTVTVDDFPWLVKFGLESDRICMAAAEAACLDLCEMAGLDTCQRDVIDIAGKKALMLERFDRRVTDRGIERIHMLSSMTLLGAHEYDRYTSGYADLHDVARKFGTGNSGEEIFRRMVMNVLCGNTDDHFRNHAFLLDGNGRYRQSPVYDVTPTLQSGSTRKMFFHLGKAGSGREATLENAIAGAPSLGLHRDQATAIVNDLAAMVSANWEKAFTERGASKDDIELVASAFAIAGEWTEARRRAEAEHRIEGGFDEAGGPGPR